MSNEILSSSKAWPFEQAKLIQRRLDIEKRRGYERGDKPVIFETGYGPSGLPHIGTFGEVVRTTMVMNAFRALTDNKIPAKLICISDDMDGMRKVPPTVPNPAILEEYLQKPLTDVPDPFGTASSYGANMNARLRVFLDSFGFEYEFKSATDLYREGYYDKWLLLTLEKYDEIMSVMLPTLGEERRATYSPFLPISPKTGRVLYVPMKALNSVDGTITFDDEDGCEITTRVTGGNVKLQWKPDFGMRWASLGVDFEMFGKDHQDNAPIYSKICKILGGNPPVQFVYELFLDEKGEKISKSKGNGISVEDWLNYAPQESLSLFNYQKPRAAKKLYFDVIPRNVDEYFQHLSAWGSQDIKSRLSNPVWHIHNGNPPNFVPPVSFSLLLNLVSAANASDKNILWGFIKRYAPDANPNDNPTLDCLAGFAVRYYEDFVKPNKVYRKPTDQEFKALKDLASELDSISDYEAKDPEALQTLIFSIGKKYEFENLRNWFKAIYEVCLGQSQGPRFGSFVSIFGTHETSDLIKSALSRYNK